jgi:NAD/NADP transhydrogenase alpha subunit
LGLGVTTLAAATTATVLGALVRSWSAELESRCQTETPADPVPDEIDAQSPPAVLHSTPGVETDADGGIE